MKKDLETTVGFDINKEKLIELLSEINNDNSIDINITTILKDITKRNEKWRKLEKVGNDIFIRSRVKGLKVSG